MGENKIGSSSESEGAGHGLGVARIVGHSDFKQELRDISFPTGRKKKVLFGLRVMKEYTFGHCREWHSRRTRSSDFPFQWEKEEDFLPPPSERG